MIEDLIKINGQPINKSQRNTSVLRALLCRPLNLCVLFSAFFSNSAFAVTWEQQAERLLQVSATLLDAPPIGSPHAARFGLNITIDASFLPKPNPTIGAKKEKVPASPVHAVPTINLEKLISINKQFFISVGGSGGYLPAGGEKIVGVKAAATQFTYGANIGGVYLASKSLRSFLDLGYHFSSAKITGAITAPDAKDEFQAKSTIFYLRPGFYFPKANVWSSVMIGSKNTTAALDIPEDDTRVFTQDKLQDAPLPAFFQFTVGYAHNSSGVNSALAYIFVPNRAYMPKIKVSWTYDFQKPKSKSPSEKNKSSTQKDKPTSQKSKPTTNVEDKKSSPKKRLP